MGGRELNKRRERGKYIVRQEGGKEPGNRGERKKEGPGVVAARFLSAAREKA